jgi:hypothetical protein
MNRKISKQLNNEGTKERSRFVCFVPSLLNFGVGDVEFERSSRV